MGYVAPGVWVPEFLLDRPEILRNLHVQFADAGSDVIEAYQVCSSVSIECAVLVLEIIMRDAIYASGFHTFAIKSRLVQSPLITAFNRGNNLIAYTVERGFIFVG